MGRTALIGNSVVSRIRTRVSPESSNTPWKFSCINVGPERPFEFVGHYIADSYNKVQPTSAT